MIPEPSDWGTNGIRRPRSAVLFSCVLLTLVAIAGPGAETQFERLYRNGEFAAIAEYLSAGPIEARELQLHHLYLESLARSGQRHRAISLLVPLRNRDGASARFFSTRGWVLFSAGRLERAGESFRQALELDSRSFQARIGRSLLLLYSHRYREAEKSFGRLLSLHPGWRQTRQVFLSGIEIYTACHDYKRLADWYRSRSRWLKKRGFSRRVFAQLKNNSRMFGHLEGIRSFQLLFEGDKASIPLIRDERSSRYWIPLKLNSQIYRVVIDTGNATGWVLHSQDLADRLKLRRGGRTVVLMGTEVDGLDGYHIVADEIDFGAFRLNYVHGYYVPKPYPGFFDANLNPAFIRGCHVILDGKQGELVMARKPPPEPENSDHGPAVALPWFGHEQPFVPVTVAGGQSGIAILETGAEDISLRESFARLNGLPLEPRKRFLATGEIYNYYVTSVAIMLAGHRLERPAAEVWPLKRFHNRLTGFGADVVIGPRALFNDYRVCFDPFNFRIRLVQQ